jgi:hypothetical protein
MTRNLGVTLSCCKTKHNVVINDRGIRNREPNEVKKNILCPNCDRLVILSFAHGSSGVSIVDQEIIDFNR